jgi:HAD superfamily hydrolase (TIGR01509 family)
MAHGAAEAALQLVSHHQSQRDWRPFRDMPSQSTLLVFDFDGVIADTEPLFWKAWVELLAPHNLQMSWEEYCRYGRGVKDEQMLRVVPQLASNPSILPTLSRQLGLRKEMIRRWCAEQSPIAEATVRMLQSLGGYRMGLVTSSDRAVVEPLLRAAGIHSCFHALVFAEDCTRHKPDPEPYLLMRRQLGGGEGIAFEDSSAGLASASAAGFSAVCVDEPQRLAEIVARTLSETQRTSGADSR